MRWEILALGLRWGIRALALVALGSVAARAEAPADLQASFAAQARREDPAFPGFSIERGRSFFTTTHGGEWSCASCHGEDPRAPGRHRITGKPIEPLAPAANPARFRRAAQAEKWFQRNCNDVLGRTCTAWEKGDVLQWLLSLEAGRAR